MRFAVALAGAITACSVIPCSAQQNLCAEISSVVATLRSGDVESLKGEIENSFHDENLYTGTIYKAGRPLTGASECSFTDFTDGPVKGQYSCTFPAQSKPAAIKRAKELEAVVNSCFPDTKPFLFKEPDGFTMANYNFPDLISISVQSDGLVGAEAEIIIAGRPGR